MNNNRPPNDDDDHVDNLGAPPISFSNSNSLVPLGCEYSLSFDDIHGKGARHPNVSHAELSGRPYRVIIVLHIPQESTSRGKPQQGRAGTASERAAYDRTSPLAQSRVLA